MLTNCVSILETRFFRIFQKICNQYIYDHQIFVFLWFKIVTDQKKRATLTNGFSIKRMIKFDSYAFK